MALALSWLARPQARALFGKPPTLGGRIVLGEPSGTWIVGALHPASLQIPAPKDKAGLCPFKELWFKESRCPRMGRTLPDGDAKANSKASPFPVGSGTLKHHPLPCEVYTCSETTGALGQSQGSPDYQPQTQIREEGKQPQPQNPPWRACKGEMGGNMRKHCIIGSP